MQCDDSLDAVTERQRMTCDRDGRTRLCRASLAKQVLGLTGTEALQWVRYSIPRAAETAEQQRLVLDDE